MRRLVVLSVSIRNPPSEPSPKRSGEEARPDLPDPTSRSGVEDRPGPPDPPSRFGKGGAETLLPRSASGSGVLPEAPMTTGIFTTTGSWAGRLDAPATRPARATRRSEDHHERITPSRLLQATADDLAPSSHHRLI